MGKNDISMRTAIPPTRRAFSFENEVLQPESVGLTQDDCVEWDEGSPVDLARVVASPCVATAATPSKHVQFPLRELEQNAFGSRTAPSRGKVSDVEKEVEDLFDLQGKEELVKPDSSQTKGSDASAHRRSKDGIGKADQKRRRNSSRRQTKRPKRHRTTENSSRYRYAPVDQNKRLRRRKRAAEVASSVKERESCKDYADLDSLLKQLENDVVAETSRQAPGVSNGQRLDSRVLEHSKATVAMPPGPTPRTVEPSTDRQRPAADDEEFLELDLSESDLAKIDALVEAATQSGTRTENLNTNHEEAQQIKKMTVPRISCGHTEAGPLPISESVKESRESVPPMEDPFGDFPEIDFAMLDKQIANHTVAEKGNSDLKASKAFANVSSAPHPARGVQSLPPSAQERVQNKTVSIASSSISFLTFTRYKVVGVEDNTFNYTKTLFVVTWKISMFRSERSTLDHADGVKPVSPSQLDGARHSFPRTKTEEQNLADAEGCIILRGEWYHTNVNSGDVVHLCSISGRYRTDSGSLPVVLHTAPPQESDVGDDLVLIVHPDMLITPTAISEAVSCSRRAVIRSRLGSSGLKSKAPLLGTMRHALFERCMSSQNFTEAAAQEWSRHIARHFADSLVACGIKDGEAEAEVINILPRLRAFAQAYTSFGDKQEGIQRTVSESGATLKGHDSQAAFNFVARTVEATEESAVSPELGLKGNIDMTVSATTTALPPNIIGRDCGEIIPREPQMSLMGVELKTGHSQKVQNSHMAQLALYSLMLRVRYGSHALKQNNDAEHTRGDGDVGGSNSGMLLYLNDKSYHAVHVSPTLNDLKSLIGQRNVVARELRHASRPRGLALSFERDSGVNRITEMSAEREKRVRLKADDPTALPPLIPQTDCMRCYANRECMTYARAELAKSPAGIHVSQSHSQLLKHFTGHLNDEDMTYFRKWNRLVDLEAHVCASSPAEAWLIQSTDREKMSGKCMSQLVFNENGSSVICSPDPGSNQGNLAGVLNATASIKLDRARHSTLKTPLSRLRIEPGSHVIISTDSTSTIESSTECTLIEDRKTQVRRRRFRHQMHVLRGIIDSVGDTSVFIQSSPGELQQVKKLVLKFREQVCDGNSQLLFRIDKDEDATGTGTLRQNLINLFTCDVEPWRNGSSESKGKQATVPRVENRMKWLRSVIVGLRQPAFDRNIGGSTFSGVPNHLKPDFSSLNSDQRHAVEKIMVSSDYSLIQGLPGSGKSHVITFVARLLAAHGKRVLISSYTHAAVDNIMAKLMEKGLASTNATKPFPEVVRVGRRSSCHPMVHPILVDSVASALDNSIQNRTNERSMSVNDVEHLPTAESLGRVIAAAKVVGTTALTIPRSPLLSRQQFDVVIVDEAGQISQPAILGAVMAADSFVLVGDHLQLPPLVKSEVAEEGGKLLLDVFLPESLLLKVKSDVPTVPHVCIGYGVSLLSLLAERFPDSVAQLTLQYRMNHDICRISNNIAYNGKMKCANDEVRSRILNLDAFPSALSSPANGQQNCQSKSWLINVVDPSKPVVFVDTDAIASFHSKRTKSGSCVTPGSRSNHQDIEVASTFHPLESSPGKGAVINHSEVTIVRSIINGLTKCGLKESSIGVISPFRAQLRLFDECATFSHWKGLGLEVSTIDRFQGRDKQAIILSFVRSNKNKKTGRLLEDFRRLNVAVSRAKMKLIMVGSFDTLQKGSSVLKPILEDLKHRNLVESLPADAL